MILLGGRQHEMTLKFQAAITGRDEQTKQPSAFWFDANGYLYEVTEIPIFTIKTTLSADSLDVTLELFANNLIYNPPLFKLVPVSKWTFDKRELSGTGRSLLCRVFRELVRAGIPADTQVVANAEPLVSTRGLNPNEEMDRLLAMYATYSFYPTKPRTLGKGGDHYLTEIQTTVGSIVEACEANARSSRGTIFNRDRI